MKIRELERLRIHAKQLEVITESVKRQVDSLYELHKERKKIINKLKKLKETTM